MAQAIRQIGLKLVTALLRVFTRPAPPGWSRSARPADDLTGR
jgi:hypothetical protein